MKEVSNFEAPRWAIAVLALTLSTFAAGCATTPQTELSWPGYDTTVSRASTSTSARVNHHATGTRRRDVVARSYVRVPDRKPKMVAARDVPVRTGGFLWPVKGRVISAFGSADNGERNDGINIAAPLGEPIRAAETGTVTYAGDELRNYGNLVLIRHDDGYVTAYAHAQSISVEQGDHVLKGQVIGYAGESGDVSRPQVHFEIRRGVEPINPQPLLASYTAS